VFIIKYEENPIVENVIAKWLASEFRTVQDVKSASSQNHKNNIYQNHGANFIIETWMNSRLYVYVLDKSIKSRTIKNTLKQNTNASVGTLFISNSALLPKNGETTKLQDWQNDLRVMNGGSIYAYGVVDDKLSIIQVNFSETMHKQVFDCWHTTDFPLDTVSVRRREFSTNIKGTWYIGDIASPQFKRRINKERASQRFHYRTKKTTPVDVAPADQLSAAYLTLQLEVSAGQDAVKEAFRKMAREYHPDVSEHDKAEAEQRFKEVKSAYDAIKSYRDWK
jgi:hypothetical protein